jgi:hypothetical protein
VTGLLWSVGGAVPFICLQAVPLVTDNTVVFKIVRTYKRKGIYNLWTEVSVKSAVHRVMSVFELLQDCSGFQILSFRNMFKPLSCNKISKIIHLEELSIRSGHPTVLVTLKKKTCSLD